MKPAYLRISPVSINGGRSSRLMVVLKTRGCEYARRNGGCTVCGFLNHSVENITQKEMVSQLDYVLANLELNGVKQIDLLTLGSFLNDNEVNPATREILLGRIAALNQIKKVLFEARAEYVTVDKLKVSKRILGDKILEFGIGLESSDDYIRNEVIKKGLSRKAFEDVVKKVKEAGCDLLVYLLIKPPHLSEKRAIEDAVNSAAYVFEVARQYRVRARVAFEPVFICKNTHLEKLFLNAQYRLVNLWSVVEVIKRTHEYGSIFVGLSDEKLSFDRLPNSCDICFHRLRDAIEEFNRTQETSVFTPLNCSCKENYQIELQKGLI
ncbi:MAG: archaeosine biosynthesis radical SAM protein RaSEA [Candidatus Aminicenantes bacterium]|jgi:radical SAM enzyme (TIGR01210 family)